MMWLLVVLLVPGAFVLGHSLALSSVQSCVCGRRFKCECGRELLVA